MPETPASQRPAPGGVASGQLIAGRYALSRLIVSGGMAEVWQGTDTVLERQVAVKILHGHLASDDGFVQRFRTEAVAAARLHHPAIVSIYDTCSDGNVEAIVMELVQGQTLRQYLDDHGPLPADEVIDIGSEVADALEAAHRSGLVHRDIKPANILLCDDHRVMVTDFGIAKIRDGVEHTQTGTMLGTVKYLAPEQVEGQPVDARTDIYALGVVLYEAIAGRVPFSADSQAATALARLHSTPPRPRQIRPSVPRALDDVIMRAISRNPGDRQRSSAEFRAALLATRHEPNLAPAAPTLAPANAAAAPRQPTATSQRRPLPPPRKQRRWVVPLLVLVVIASVLAIVVVLLNRTRTGNELLGTIGEKTPFSIPGSAAPLKIVDAAPFDPPPGDRTEGDGDRLKAIDGNPATSWKTEQYSTRNLGGGKPGVGLKLTLEGSKTVDALKVTSPTPGWSAQVYVSETGGDALQAWGPPIAQQTNINQNVDFDLQGAKGKFVLLWITDVGTTRCGSIGTCAEISEVTVLGS